jgi:cytochrome b pre-mRNA-processing protein 3
MNIRGWLAQGRQNKDTARQLYTALVAQARRPVFYAALGVPDTVDGRFDNIALHAFMVMRAVPGMTPRLRQALFDVMFKDFERACREMGIGDLSVPRHVKRMMTAFKGRFFAYEQAVNDPQMLRDALVRNLYRKVESVDIHHVNAVARYVTASLAVLAQSAVPAAPVFANPEEFDGREQAA